MESIAAGPATHSLGARRRAFSEIGVGRTRIGRHDGASRRLFAHLAFTGCNPLIARLVRITAQRPSDEVGTARPPSHLTENGDSPEILLTRNPEISKALSPRPFALILNVIFVDLEPLPAKSDQDLVPDGGASFRVSEA